MARGVTLGVALAGFEYWLRAARTNRGAARETAYLMRSPANARRLLDAMERLEGGKGVKRDLHEAD